MDGLQLHLQRERRGEALQIVFRRGNALRLQEELVGILTGKCAQFILYAGAITGPLTVNQTGKQWGAVKTRAQNLMHFLIRVEEIAIHLLTSSLDGGRNIQI